MSGRLTSCCVSKEVRLILMCTDITAQNNSRNSVQGVFTYLVPAGQSPAFCHHATTGGTSFWSWSWSKQAAPGPGQVRDLVHGRPG